MTKKKFCELNLNNAFLFAAAMADPETCQLILEVILERPIGKVSVHTEHSILFSSDYKSVRLDVFASDETHVDYNVEMQDEHVGSIAKRSRFYQAEMDVTSLKPGEDYNDLKPNYIIFICTFDPFGQKLYRYIYENRCRETNQPLNDGTTKIFLNTRGKNPEDVPQVLVDFLRYVEESSETCAAKSIDKRIKKLHDKIKQLKKSREWEGHYMKFEELLRNAEAKGEGKGELKMLNLIHCMSENGEAELIPKLSEDEAFFAEMLQKYHLNI